MEIIYALLLAFGIMLVWTCSTVVSFIVTRGKELVFMMTVTVITWGLKFLLVLGAFALLKGYSFYDHNVFAAVVFIVALISTALEAWYFMKASKSMFQPPSSKKLAE